MSAMFAQGMMANRFMDTFRDDITGWQHKLLAVADIAVLTADIQRVWAYLESLFIGSQEVQVGGHLLAGEVQWLVRGLVMVETSRWCRWFG